MPLAPFLKNSLNQTSLDIENSQPNGGPNITNAGDLNTPTGFYQTTSPETGQALKDENGDVIITQLHRYLPNNKYLDTINPNNS